MYNAAKTSAICFPSELRLTTEIHLFSKELVLLTICNENRKENLKQS